MNPTGIISEYLINLSFSDIPAEAVDRVKTAIMDYVGSTLAGLTDESSIIARDVVKELGGNPQATVWGSDFKISAPLAAMANGTAAHALDCDDTNIVMMAHPSIQLLPALFALGEYRHVRGEDIILSYIVGFEIGAMLGRAMNPELVAYGWFPVGPLGVFMQTAACSKLLGLNRTQIENGLGIAANSASGLRCNNGTMAKPLMPGSSAANAILATLMAARGMTSNRKALEDKFGLFENFTRKDVSFLEASADNLIGQFEILQSGLNFKLYPSCAGTHAPIDCALEIVQQHQLDAKNIKEVSVSVNPGVRFLLIHSRPKTGMEGKFSLEYCVARAILDKEMGPDQFAMEKIQDTILKILIEKVTPCYEESIGLGAKVQIKTMNGERYSFEVEQARGMPGSPLNKLDLIKKFYKCAGISLDNKEIDKLLEQLIHFEQIEDIAQLIPNLAES